MADISKIKTPNNTEYNVKDAALTTEITNARGNYVNLDARLDNYDEVIGDIDTALNIPTGPDNNSKLIRPVIR